jgi:hypothetical protein
VLIDFGRSRKITKANRFATSNLSTVDYRNPESLEAVYQYGTLGYSAPECFTDAVEGSSFPFTENFSLGKMSVESDIFSWGATFWECLNIFELVTKNKSFSEDAHDFYQDNFLNDDLYPGRDLSCTSRNYHKKLDMIIRKCTKKRTINYLDNDNKGFYHSYSELKRDIENTMNSVPTILKEENVKVKKAFNLCGAMLSFFLVFLAIYGIYRLSAFNIAEKKWDSMTTNYNDTQFYRLEEIAKDLIVTAPVNEVNATYDKIAVFTYQGNEVSEYEAQLLVDLLLRVNNSNELPKRVDDIMMNANSKKFREISTEIVRLGLVQGSIGYDLAQAIFNVEVCNSNVAEAYDILQKYHDSKEFINAVIKLRNVLDSDKLINYISENKSITRQEILNFFKSITA